MNLILTRIPGIENSRYALLPALESSGSGRWDVIEVPELEAGGTGDDNFFLRNCSCLRALRLIFEGVLWHCVAPAGEVLAEISSLSLESKENWECPMVSLNENLPTFCAAMLWINSKHWVTKEGSRFFITGGSSTILLIQGISDTEWESAPCHRLAGCWPTYKNDFYLMT